MGNLANMNLEINEEVVQTIFKETLNQSIINAMGNKEEYMSALIHSVLGQKVDRNGKVSNYSSENKYSFIEIHVNKEIREAAKKAIEEFISDNREQLKLTVKKEMEKEENKSAIVNAFIKGASDSFNYNYNFSASVDIKKVEEEEYY